MRLKIFPNFFDALFFARPITVILSQKGWIRCLKGYADLTESFKFKDDDALAYWAIMAYV